MLHKKIHIYIEDISWAAVFIYFLLMFCISSTVFPIRPYLLTALPLLILVIEIIIFNKNLTVSKSMISFMVLYYIGLISSVINKTFFEWTALQNFLQFPAICLGIYLLCDSKAKMLKLLKIIFWIGFIGGPIIGLYQMAIGDYLYPVPADSIYKINIFIKTIICTAIQYNANYVALHMTLILYIGFYLMTNVIERKNLYLFAVIITFVCLMLTYSRTAMIAVVFSFFIYASLWVNRYKTALKMVEMIYLLLVILFIALIIVIVSGVDILDIINQSLSDNLKKLMVIKDTGNVIIRIEQWKASLIAIMKAPILNKLFGFGENYNYVLARYSGYEISAHNTIFGQLMTNGIIGAIITIVIMVATFRKLFILNEESFKNSILFCGYIALIVILQMISALSIEIMIFFVLSDLILKLNKSGSMSNEPQRHIIS